MNPESGSRPITTMSARLHARSRFLVTRMEPSTISAVTITSSRQLRKARPNLFNTKNFVLEDGGLRKIESRKNFSSTLASNNRLNKRLSPSPGALPHPQFFRSRNAQGSELMGAVQLASRIFIAGSETFSAIVVKAYESGNYGGASRTGKCELHRRARRSAPIKN